MNLVMLVVPSTRLWFCVAALAVTVASGCAQTVRFQVWQPAEFDVVGIQRLAVLDFRGPDDTSRQARSELVARLWDSGFFALADPTALNAVVQTSATQIDGDLGAAIETGRRLNVDAILVGEVIRSSGEVGGGRRAGHAPPPRDGSAPHSPRSMPHASPSVALSLQLIDVHRPDRAQRQASYRIGGEFRGQGYVASQEAATRELIQKWAREMTDC